MFVPRPHPFIPPSHLKSKHKNSLHKNFSFIILQYINLNNDGIWYSESSVIRTSIIWTPPQLFEHHSIIWTPILIIQTRKQCILSITLIWILHLSKQFFSQRCSNNQGCTVVLYFVLCFIIKWLCLAPRLLGYKAIFCGTWVVKVIKNIWIFLVFQWELFEDILAL